MANPSTPPPPPDPIADDLGDEDTSAEQSPVCVMCFNANDPSGAAGLGADITALASVGTHALAVVTGAYARDSAEIFDHFAFDDEAVSEQARAVLEDMNVEVFKVGFVGSPENLAAIAEIAADYSEVPLVAYMPNLSWWAESAIETYLDAFKELMLPQTTVLVGNHSTLWRWLLPEWASERPPTARDIARAASELGVPYTMVTGIPGAEQHIENTVASAQSILTSQHFERFEAVFSGAGETLSAALAGLLATGEDLPTAANEALLYLDRALNAGFRPGMGHVLPDRLFWAQPDDDDDDTPDSSLTLLDLPTPDTKH
jgi:hydroxymethylpyrimidine/phosphomethylpyrimidine kinase